MLRELSLSQTQVAGGLEPLRRLTSLQKLALRETNLTGLIDEIGTLPELIEADLSGAPLHGTLAAARCSKLRKLSVADTQVSEIRPRSFSNYYEFSSNPDNNWLPALQHLNVSGCPLKRSLADFLLPLAGTPVTVISAARCGLTGYMPDLYGIPAFVDNAWTQQWYSPLGRSLQVVDLSGNNIQHLRKVPVSLRIDVSRNGEALEVAPEVIRHCMQNDIELWLLETSLSNGEKVEEELRTMALDGFWMDSKNSYGCQSFLAPNVRVTPDVFWANGMCGCRPGYSGTGINCTACSRNSFNSQYNQSACQHCPANSTSAQASTSQDACQCRYGALFPTDSPNAEAKCHCPRREALSVADGDGQCISCSKHHLQCPEPGAVVSDAAVEPGFWRPKGSEKVYQCLDAERCSNSSCAPGYAGQLCAECADMHRSSGKRCVKCSDVPLKQRMPVIASVASAALAVMGVLAVWRYRSGSGSVPWSLRAQCVFRLLILELPMLLQLVQLWVVLGRLANTQVTAMVTAKKEKCLGDVLVSYLQALLLTSAEIQNFASLQCLFDPTTVRAVFAVATPVLPMLLLITCGFVDVARPGTGIRVGLKLLTLLYIGGASGTAQLLECQEVDGGGKVSLDFPFRPQFPHWLCKDALWVNWIGWSSAVCYGLMIPCCLAYLFAKQRVVMRQSDTFMMPAIKREGKWILTSQELMSKQGSKQLKDEKLLLAAAVANVAALAKGKAFVELREGTAIVSFADAGNVDEGFSVESIVFDAAETETLRYRSLTEMLIERSKLEDLDDRVMLGAKDLFCKYAKCQNVWVEVCSKVAAVALVSVVNSKDGLWLSIAITLGMALAIGLVRPFAQPQVWLSLRWASATTTASQVWRWRCLSCCSWPKSLDLIAAKLSH
ncbi:unnamed protein product [Durusdinium trenchii]|uniref:Uncharacterized protein n=1 Tax=Durusdinium trenchii TaxID=1381693 RepID=A0ABP0IZC1_9DINO